MKYKIIIAVLFLLCLSGCRQSASIEEKNYVLVLGIDKAEGRSLTVSYSKADISKLQGENGAIAGSKISTYAADSLEEAGREDEMDDAKELSLGHLKAILIGEELRKDSTLYQKTIQEIQSNSDIARTVLIYESRPSAEKLMDLEKDISGTLGEYIEQLSKKQKQVYAREEVTLNEAIIAQSVQDGKFYLPVLEIKENRIHLCFPETFTKKEL